MAGKYWVTKGEGYWHAKKWWDSVKRKEREEGKKKK